MEKIEEIIKLQVKVKELENKLNKSIKLPAYIALIVAILTISGTIYVCQWQ